MRKQHPGSDVVRVLPDNKKSNSRKKAKLYICDICGKTLKRSDGLLEHKMYVHGGMKKKRNTQRRYICEICGASYKSKYSLDEHNLIKHCEGAVLKYKCDQCPKSFYRNHLLQNHVNKEHLKERPFQCTICQKKFYSQYYLYKHVKAKVCQGPKFANITCMHCGVKYREKHQLEMHLVAKHYGGAFQCVCGFVVQWASSVTRHKRRCKVYQKYVAANGEAEKVFNVIQVPYNTDRPSENSLSTLEAGTAKCVEVISETIDKSADNPETVIVDASNIVIDNPEDE